MIVQLLVQHPSARLPVRTFVTAGTAWLALAAASVQAQAQATSAPDVPVNAAPIVAPAFPASIAPDADIVVTGSRPIAESEVAALKIQRDSASLISVVAADSVGRLPDQNIAQAVSRLPGVAVQRDQGQARYINLRGAPIQWTTVAFDGINVVSPEGRDTRFDSIPSAIASQIIVRKAVTPDLTGETIAGQVDVITRTAFDYKGFHIAGKAGAGYVELGKSYEYETSGVLSNRWDTGIGEIGILGSASIYTRRIFTDNFETDWEVVSRDQRPGFTDRVWARETENKLYRATRRNYSGSGRLDWRPDPNNRLFASAIYSAFTDDELRNNYIFDLDDQESRLPNANTACDTSVKPPTANTTGYADVCAGNTPFLGTNYAVDIASNFLVRDYRQSIFTSTVGGDHDGGPLKFRWRGNFTKAVDDRSAPIQLNYDSPGFATPTQRPTVAYDLRDRQQSFVELYRTVSTAGVFSRGARVRQIEDFPLVLTRVRSLIAKDITQAYTGKADLSYDAGFAGGEATFTIGAQYDRRTKTSNELLLDLASAAQIAAAGIPTGYSAIDNGKSYLGELPLGYDFNYFDQQKAVAFREQADTVGNFDPVPANFYKVREEVYAGFAMATVKYDWGNIVGGARVEHIKNDSRANVTLNGVTGPIAVKNEQTIVYPSLHFNFDVDDTKKLRLSFNTGAARPDYDQLRPNFTFNDGNQTISGGNPEAKPEKARGVDLYGEWYVQPQGFLSLGVFYKDIKDALFATTRTFGLDVLDTPTLDRSQYTFSTIDNGGDGYLYGVEAAFSQQLEPYTAALGLPDWMGGFGIQVNATYNQSEVETPDGRKVDLPGTSDLVYNLGGYYEKYGFSARVNYQYRTDWIDVIGSAADGGDPYWANDAELDVSLRYALTPNFEVYLDGANLLDGPGRRFAGVSARTLERETFGRRYTGGVRVNF